MSLSISAFARDTIALTSFLTFLSPPLPYLILLIFDAMANVKKEISWKIDVDDYTLYSIVSPKARFYFKGQEKFFFPHYEGWMVSDIPEDNVKEK